MGLTTDFPPVFGFNIPPPSSPVSSILSSIPPLPHVRTQVQDSDTRGGCDGDGDGGVYRKPLRLTT